MLIWQKCWKENELRPMDLPPLAAFLAALFGAQRSCVEKPSAIAPSRPFSPRLGRKGEKIDLPPAAELWGGRTLLRWENHLVSGYVNLLHSIGLSSFSQRSSAFSDVFYNLLLPRSRPLLHTRCQHVTMVQKAPSRMFQLVVRMGQEFMVV